LKFVWGRGDYKEVRTVSDLDLLFVPFLRFLGPSHDYFTVFVGIDGISGGEPLSEETEKSCQKKRVVKHYLRDGWMFANRRS